MDGVGETETNAEVKSLNDVIEDLKRVMSSGNRQGTYSVEVPGALVPQFQLLNQHHYPFVVQLIGGIEMTKRIA